MFEHCNAVLMCDMLANPPILQPPVQSKAAAVIPLPLGIELPGQFGAMAVTMWLMPASLSSFGARQSLVLASKSILSVWHWSVFSRILLLYIAGWAGNHDLQLLVLA